MELETLEETSTCTSFAGPIDEPLDEDLEALDSSRSRVGGIWGRPSVYVLAFETMINTVVEHERHLLSSSELRIIEGLRCLSYNARYCLFRLILRKSDTWHTVASLKSYEKEVNREGILDAIDELCASMDDILANPPLGSSQSGSSQDLSLEAQPPASSSQNTGPEIIDLTFDSDDEDVKPQINNAVAISSRTHSSPSQTQFNFDPSLDALDSTDWDCNFDFFCENDTSMTLDEALNKLNVDQLKELVKAMKVKPSKMNKPAMILALRNHAMTQSVLDFNSKGKGKAKAPSFGAPSGGLRQTRLPFTHQKRSNSNLRQSQERRLMDMALQKLGRSVRVNTNLYWFVVRLNIIYERSMEYPKSFLVPSLLTSFKKRAYPEYSYLRDPTIWESRQALLDYVEALRLEAALEKELDTRMDKPNLKTPIPGSGKTAIVTPSTPAPPQRATSLRTPLRASPQKAVSETPVCKKEEPEEMDNNPVDEVEQEGDNAKKQRAHRIKALFDESIFPRWKEFVTDKTNKPASVRTPGLERFEPGYVYTRMFSRVLESLACLKVYDEELIVLDALLNQRLWRRGKRAKWYERRAIILSKYLCFYWNEEGKKVWRREVAYRALEGVREALQDEDTGIVSRPGFVRRLRRLEKRLRLPPEECCQCERELATVPKVFCAGVRVYASSTSLKLDSNGRPLQDNANQNTTVKDYFPSTGSKVHSKADKENIPQSDSPSAKWKWKGKSLWRGRNGEDINVETRALEYYEDKGYKGFHSETRVVTTIFALLMWDIIFADVPGAFETPHQIAPLDLATDSFYRARKEAIEARLDELRIPGRAAQLLEERDEEHRPKNTWCIGVRWDICERQDLVEICLKGETLPIVCRLLCEDYSGRSSGVPDLIVWNPQESRCKFVEVKGPGDRPQENQKLWFDTLMGAGAEVELCLVYDVNKPPRPPKKNRSRGRKQADNAAPKQDMEVECEPESEEDALESNQTTNSDAEYWDSLPDIGAPSAENEGSCANKRGRSPSLSDLVPAPGLQTTPGPAKRRKSGS